MKSNIHLLLVVSLSLCSQVYSELLSGFGAVALAGLITAFGFKCNFYECCDGKWIPNNFTDLQIKLDKQVYGQHLVNGPVIKHLKGHSKSNPSKALVLSLHGWTGTGKNFVSKLVAESMFKKGMKSKYVHLISATKEFPHEEKVYLYKDKLRQTIENAVKECPRSLFIIDEMDKMPAGLIDTIKPYLDYYEELGGVDYKQTTFFLLSNTAGSDISKYTIKQWNDSRTRESIQLNEMEKVIKLPVLNSDGQGLWHSELITKHLITAYIPFLPLERVHVKQCIRQGMVRRGYYKEGDRVSEAKVQEVLDQLTFYPEDLKLFSVTGCKRVDEKIDFIMENL